ncbi:MAG TPA: tetratricopeptide repeat protein [Flavobacteriales bacterium]|nr:tetratricopeptide repeat protein [Flavobacteriales bacterium]
MSAYHVSGQDKIALDSLSKQVKSTNVEIKVNALNELCRIFSGIDNAKAMQMANEAVAVSKSSNNQQLIAQSLNRLGTIYDVRGVIDSANMHFLTALKLFEGLKDKSGIAAVQQNIGVMYYFQGDLEKAQLYYLKAMKLREQTNELDYVAKLLNNLAVIARRNEDYEKSILYHKKALAIKLKFKDRESVASAYSNIATTFLYKRDFDSAIAYIDKSIKINEEIKSTINLAGNYFVYAEIYFNQGKNRESVEWIKKSIDLGIKSESNAILYNCYELWWQVDTAMGNYKDAVVQLNNAAAYKAKVFKREKAEAVEQLNVLYETEKKDKEIIGLSASEQQKKTENRFLVAGLCLLFLLLIITGIYFIKIRRKNRLLAAQKKEVEEKTSELNRQAAEIARFRTQMNPHFMFNALVSIQKSILTEDKKTAGHALTQLSKLMRMTLDNSEKELISLEDEKKFLEMYIEFEKERCNHSFTYEINIMRPLDLANTLIPTMIIQPFVENAVKHALSMKNEGGRLTITITQTPNRDKNGEPMLGVLVEDNGKGINHAKDGKMGQDSHTSKGMNITLQRIKTAWDAHGGYQNSYFGIYDKRDDPSYEETGPGTVVSFSLPYVENF